MKKTFNFNLIVTMTLLSLGACTWVDVEPGAEAVAIISSEQASACDKLGAVSAKTLDAVWLYERNQEKLQQELQTIAANDAFKMGANAIVAVGEIIEGEQSFLAYRCLGAQ